MRLKENVGPGAARNIGANNAKTRWLLFIDSDCSLPLSSIENAFPTEIEELNREKSVKIQENADFENCSGLSNEVKEILTRHKPQSIGAARELPGMTPDTV